MLVIEHNDASFTKGIILNRPTDQILDDDVNPGLIWRVWFGGDVQGLHSDNPEIICLHSLTNEQAQKASLPVFNEIQWTTFSNAKQLVKAKLATPKDFWVFTGYAGWGPQQLMGELERKSWYTVATDSNTLLKELARQSASVEPRDAGLDTWNQLMNMIGKKDKVDLAVNNFDDLMLKEWALENLLSKAAGGGGGMFRKPTDKDSIDSTVINNIDENDEEWNKPKPIDELLQRVVSTTSVSNKIVMGSLVRAKNPTRSPFLLQNQELHKAVLVIIQEDANLVVGAMLNRPSGKSIDIQIKDRLTGATQVEKIPVRFGGQYTVQGSPLLWLHNNPSLKNAGIGFELGTNRSGIFRCTVEDVSKAISTNMASPDDFMVISGVAVWAKDNSMPKGVLTPIVSSNFEVIHETRVKQVWDSLVVQEALDQTNLSSSVSLAGDVWAAGDLPSNVGRRSTMSPSFVTRQAGKLMDSDMQKKNSTTNSTTTGSSSSSIGGLGENYDEEDDDMVFKSDVKVTKLGDMALAKWLRTFLTDWPSTSGGDSASADVSKP